MDSLEKEMDRLKGKGVGFSDVRDDAQARLSFFTDPEGNPSTFRKANWARPLLLSKRVHFASRRVSSVRPIPIAVLEFIGNENCIEASSY